MLAGILGMVVFNLVDTFFVGILGTEELAAMGFYLPGSHGGGSIARGLGAGASSVISRAIGGADSAEVRFLTTAALILAVTIVTAIITVGFPLLSPLFTLLGAQGRTHSLVIDYMRIWLVGVPFVVIPMVGNNAIRATGNMATPAAIMLAAAGANCNPRPCFHFRPRSRSCPWPPGSRPGNGHRRMLTLGLSMTVLHRRYRMLDWGFVELRRCAAPLSRLIDAWLRLIRIGLPAAATNLVLPVSLGIVTRMVSAYGTAAVAGFAVARADRDIRPRLPAGSRGRRHPVFRTATRRPGSRRTSSSIACEEPIGGAAAASALWALLVFLLVLAAGRMIAGVFATDPAVVDVTADYLTIVAGSYAFQGMMLFVSAAFNGLNQPLRSAVTSLTRMVIFYIPLALLLRALWGINGVFAAAALANVGTGTLAVWWLLRRTGRLISA
jgi:Na+-driven multidrug efflux pump